MPLTSFELLSDEWEGNSIVLPFGAHGEERHVVTGWTDLIFGNPYPDIVRGAPAIVHVAKVRQGDHVGFLVYGGNSGVRIGGKNGRGMPVIWIEDENDLPTHVRQFVNPSSIEQEQKEDAFLVSLCREAGNQGTDEELIEGARNNHHPDDIRDAANGDIAAIVKLRRAFGLLIFI